MSVSQYTGAVVVDGPADVRRLPALTIAKLAVGGLDNNAYLLRCTRTGAGMLIDAAAEPDRLAPFVRIDASSSSSPIESVLTTHQHVDHWQALAAVVGDTGASTLAGVQDVTGISVPTDRALAHGDTVSVGEVPLEIIGLRGHTPGSIAVLYRDPAGSPHLFTGDSLFPGGVGKTWSTADFESLLADVSSRLFDELPDDTWFYPGHGLDSTLGVQRPQLAGWRARGW